MNNPFEYPVVEAGNNFAGRGGMEKNRAKHFYLTFLKKRKMEMGMKGQRGSVKMFGKEIEFPLGGKEGKKKSFFPYVFERGSRKLVVHRRVCMCVEVARTITFPPTFFRFSSSLWILVGKGNFSAGWHSRALVKRRRHSAQLPILSVVRSTSTRERETGEWLIEREREREIKINAGERIIRPL